MKLSKERQGEFFIFGATLLWSLFPIITVLSYNSVSPLVSLTISSFFSTIFFATIITLKKIWHEVFNTAAYKNILLATFFLGILYYLLVYTGLQFTSPGNAAIISLTQIFFSFLLFHVFRREHIPRAHTVGAFLMVLGALIVLASSFTAFHMGDILILLANVIAPIGNFFAQKSRKQVSSEMIMFIRSTISTGAIFLLVLTIQTPFSTQAIQTSLPFLLINGVLLLGLSKILWIDGIHRISVTKANSLESVAPLFTLIFAFMFLHQIPTIWQLLSLIPICVGVILLSKNQAKPAVTIPEEN